jgi:hypothetical protein
MSRRELLERASGLSFETFWDLLQRNREEFVSKLTEKRQNHQRILSMNPSGQGDHEYNLMQFVLDEYNRIYRETGAAAGAPPPPPPPAPAVNVYAGQFWMPPTAPLNAGSAQPELTRTPANPMTVQWIQGNRIIMRPEDREVRPGEPMSRIRILR